MSLETHNLELSISLLSVIFSVSNVCISIVQDANERVAMDLDDDRCGDNILHVIEVTFNA